MAKRFTPAVRARFLEALRRTANVTEAARRVGISRSRLYDLRRKDPELDAGWREALDATADRLEAEAIRRAVDGDEEPYFYQGRECGRVVKRSDSLLKFLLQHRRPDVYGDGGDGGDGNGQAPAVVFEMHFPETRTGPGTNGTGTDVAGSAGNGEAAVGAGRERAGEEAQASAPRRDRDSAQRSGQKQGRNGNHNTGGGHDA